MDLIKMVIVPTVVISTVIIFGMNLFSNSQVKQACKVFSQESGRETKYVEYTFFHVDCLTPQKDGWISAFNLRGQ